MRRANPGRRDEIQAIKAGIMEVADIFVLNKSDLPGADRAEAHLHAWVTRVDDGEWPPRIVRTVGTRGDGIDALKGRSRTMRTGIDRAARPGRNGIRWRVCVFVRCCASV